MRQLRRNCPRPHLGKTIGSRSPKCKWTILGASFAIVPEPSSSAYLRPCRTSLSLMKSAKSAVRSVFMFCYEGGTRLLAARSLARSSMTPRTAIACVHCCFL